MSLWLEHDAQENGDKRVKVSNLLNRLVNEAKAYGKSKDKKHQKKIRKLKNEIMEEI